RPDGRRRVRSASLVLSIVWARILPSRPAVGCRGSPLAPPHRASSGGTLLELAQLAVDAARRAGADLADARAGTDESESITVRDEHLEGVERSTSTGVGIRVLVRGRWGFAATAQLNEGEI